MHQFLPKKELARIFEHYSIQGFVILMEKSFKSLMQVVIANLVFSNFLPFWSEVSPACQSKFEHGGIPYSESIAATLATIMFYVALPFITHLLLNTVAYGLSPPLKRSELLDQDAAAIEAAAKGRHVEPDDKKQARMRRRGATANGDYTVADAFFANKDENSFRLFNRVFTIGNEASFFNLNAAKAGIKEIVIEDVFIHDPRFWQQPWRWLHYFVRERANGSLGRGFKLYFDSMRWKLTCFLKLSFGFWDESLTENMHIKYRSSRFGVANEAGFDTKHESMLMTTGETHALIWLFFPFCAFFSKAGETFNESLLFVRDDTVERAIAAATERHRFFLADQKRRDVDHSAEDHHWLKLMGDWLPSMDISDDDDDDDDDDDEGTSTQLRSLRGVARAIGRLGKLRADVENAKTLDEESALPRGWMTQPSMSWPGRFRYVHYDTGLETHQRVTAQNQHAVLERLKQAAMSAADITTDLREQAQAKPAGAGFPESKNTQPQPPRGDGVLPNGWRQVQSRTRPGVTYEHIETGAWSSQAPTSSTEQSLIDSWRRRAAVSAAQAKIDEQRGAQLVSGWRAVPSNSKPGEVAYEHVSGARSREVPTLNNQHAIIDMWKKQAVASPRPKVREKNFRVADLPTGWIPVPSHVRPGEFAFKHLKTDTRTSMVPSLENQQSIIDGFKQAMQSPQSYNAGKFIELGPNNVLTSTSIVSTTPIIGAVVPSSDDDESVAEFEQDRKEIPDGWVAVPSRSRYGEVAYKHLETGTRSTEAPSLQNQQSIIDKWQRALQSAVHRSATERPDSMVDAGSVAATTVRTAGSAHMARTAVDAFATAARMDNERRGGESPTRSRPMAASRSAEEWTMRDHEAMTEEWMQLVRSINRRNAERVFGTAASNPSYGARTVAATVHTASSRTDNRTNLWQATRRVQDQQGSNSQSQPTSGGAPSDLVNDDSSSTGYSSDHFNYEDDDENFFDGHDEEDEAEAAAADTRDYIHNDYGEDFFDEEEDGEDDEAEGATTATRDDIHNEYDEDFFDEEEDGEDEAEAAAAGTRDDIHNEYDEDFFDEDDEEDEEKAAAADTFDDTSSTSGYSTDFEHMDKDGENGSETAVNHSVSSYIPKDFCCPLALNLMRDPVVASDGQTYERSSIENWFKEGHTESPLNDEPFTSTNLYANYRLRSMILEWEWERSQQTRIDAVPNGDDGDDVHRGGNTSHDTSDTFVDASGTTSGKESDPQMDKETGDDDSNENHPSGCGEESDP